jgi:ABC-type bacteriocin/lantibiotic exporter with double-glycine peptidase domain
MREEPTEDVAAMTGVLSGLASACDLDFDDASARDACRRACREVPGPMVEVWAERLRRAGRELGLRLTEVQWSARDAVGRASHDSPVVVYSAGREPPDRWVLLHDSGWLGARATSGGGKRLGRLGAARLAALVGRDSAAEPAAFIVAHAARPAEGLAAPRGHGHHGDHGGAGHGHGHGGGHGHGHGHMGPSRRLLGLLWPERSEIVTLLIFAVAVGVLTLAIPLTVDALVSNVAFGSLLLPLIVLALVLFGCLLLSGAVRALQVYVLEVLQRRIFVRVAADLAWRLPRVRTDALDRAHGPELVNRFFDVLTVQKGTAMLLLDGITVVLSALVGLTVLAFYHPFLLGFAVVLIVALFFIVFVMGRGAVRTAIAESLAKYEVAGWLEELVRHPTAFRTAGGAELALDRLDQHARRYLMARRSHFRILLSQIVGSLLLQAVAATALLTLGGWLVISNQLTLGQLVASELIVSLVVSNVAKLGKHLETWYDMLAATDKLGHLADLPVEREGGEARHAETAGIPVEAEHVTYAYGGPHGAVSLPDLKIAAGERVALVGPGGSGASTLLDLLYGLREPHHGHIVLDGLDTRQWRLGSLREDVALVRDPEVAEGTVVENVRMGRGGMSLVEVRTALEAAAVWEEILDLPAGLNTGLTTGGRPLSYGQALRLTLARALAGSPRLLLLDGTLDRLAPAVRERVCRSVFAPDRGWTVVVVSQLEDVLRHCGRRIELTPNSPHASAEGH